MTKHVQDLMNSNMELDMGVMGCDRCDVELAEISQ